MYIKIVSPILYFNYIDGDSISVANEFTINVPSGNNVSKEFENIKFIWKVGVIGMEKIKNSNCFIWKSEDDPLSNTILMKEGNEVLHYQIGVINMFLAGLWFVKDHSCSCINGYLATDNFEQVFINSRDTFTCNSHGEYVTENFTKVEINQAETIVGNLLELFGPKKTQIDESNRGTSEKYEAKLSELNLADYHFNRIERAFHLLNIARVNSLLTVKVSFYIATLESLFTNDNFEIKYKVAQRVCLYLGGEKSEILKNKKLIEDAYKIRSNYFHGGNQDKNYKKRSNLKEISFNLDQLVRRVFTNVISIDSQEFLKEEGLANYFEELLYSNWTKKKTI
jgi:hypothetical protein